MKAALIHEYGPPDVFRVEDIPTPEPGPRDVQIEVHAASVNPVDWKIRSGGQRGIIWYRLPWVLGLDVSGVVAAVGDRVTKFAVGDEVYASPTHRRQGTYAEYVCIDERAVARKPANLSHAEAASIPLVGLTSWNALVDKIALEAGEKILIHAGSGGVGSFAIQLARDLGASVATTCSGRNVELVRELGANTVIDYTQQDFAAELSDYDAVYDTMGGEIRKRSLTVLRRGGRLATIVLGLPGATQRYGPVLGTLMAGFEAVNVTVGYRLRGVRAYHVLRPCDGERLQRITERIEAGAIRPVIDKVFPLDDIAEAHRYSETGRARGKIAIAVR